MNTTEFDHCEYYRRVSTLTNDFVYVCQRRGTGPFRLQWMAGAVEAITGYPQDEVLALGCWLPLVYVDDRERVMESLDRVKPGDSILDEFRIVTKTGDIRWIQESSRCESDGEPDCLMLYGASRDITEKKLAEISLQERELFLREAQRVGHLGTYDYDISRDCWKNSLELDAIFGIDSSFSRTLNGWLTIIHPDLQQQMGSYFAEIVASKKWFDMEYRIIRPSDGSERWVYGTGEFSLDAAGVPVRMIGTIQDITDRKAIELQLRTSEERFRSIMALSPDIISIIGEEGALLYNSPAALAIHGYTDEEMVGRNTFELIHPDDQAHIADVFNTLLGNPSAIRTVQYRYRNKSGSYDWMEATACNQLGNPLIKGIVAISRNIAPRKELENQRLELERHLSHIQKLESLGVLAGGIAHDFNNLLAVVLGNLDFALLRLQPDSPAYENIEQAIRACKRATDLTGQMLAYSGKGAFQLKLVDLNEIVTNNGDFFRTVVSRSISLAINLAPDLPRIMADQGQMQQIIMNLITNAAEAISEKSGSVTIVTGSTVCDDACIQKSLLTEKPRPGVFVYVEVADNGCGMNEEVRRRLFDPFFTTKFTGRGLGMAVVQGIVKAHKGIILLESEEGIGTCFRIMFPVADGDAVRMENQDSVPVESGSPPPANRGVILVVDDDDCVRGMVASFVKFCGYEPLEAANGAEALELFGQHGDDITMVILDLTMPVMDGSVAFHQLRKIRPDICVILSSGYSEQEMAEQFETDMPDAFIQKPYQLNELKNKIDTLI